MHIQMLLVFCLICASVLPGLRTPSIQPTMSENVVAATEISGTVELQYFFKTRGEFDYVSVKTEDGEVSWVKIRALQYRTINKVGNLSNLQWGTPYFTSTGKVGLTGVWVPTGDYVEVREIQDEADITYADTRVLSILKEYRNKLPEENWWGIDSPKSACYALIRNAAKLRFSIDRYKEIYQLCTGTTPKPLDVTLGEDCPETKLILSPPEQEKESTVRILRGCFEEGMIAWGFYDDSFVGMQLVPGVIFGGFTERGYPTFLYASTGKKVVVPYNDIYVYIEGVSGAYHFRGPVKDTQYKYPVERMRGKWDSF